MDFESIMKELESLGSDRTKKIYMQQGAREPLYGVATGAMKPLVKAIKINQPLAERLYATGNYDAMYLAGMIADPKSMTIDDFDRWMESAYFYMISDYIVAVTLSESEIAQAVSDTWIKSDRELHVSAGYSCYCWLLGNRKDDYFDKDKIDKMLEVVAGKIGEAPDRARFAMSYFVAAIGVSYLPLHEKALQISKDIQPVEIIKNGSKRVHHAEQEIQKAIQKGRIGFKRRYVRC